MKIALGIEYDGAPYQGFQLQDGVASIQGELERAIGVIAHQDIRIICAGRTDAGVHATNQVVHFEYEPKGKSRTLYSWSKGVNTFLPDDIAVKWASEVPEDFSARFSAFSRTYRYIIWNGHMRPGILSKGISDYSGARLDDVAMHKAAQFLIGENDFTSFRAAHCQSKSPFRNVHEISVVRRGDFIVIEITANAFLYHMVRNIAGALLEVGYGKKSPEWIGELLELKDRTKAGVTALPGGLYLVGVGYDPKLSLPSDPVGPLWF